MTEKPKRPYSREFPMKGPSQEKRRAISVEASFALVKSFRDKVKAAGLNQRGLLLRWIQNWTAGRRPDEDQ